MAGVLAYFVLPALLLVLGVPIFLVLLVTCLVVILFVADVPTQTVQTFLFSALDNFPLLAVPFFVLAGEIMAQGGIARRVVVWVMALVGGVRGSLAVTTVAASEVFGAMAHTAVGTVVAMGRMLYPSLRENGYNERFAVGLIASSGAVAIVIPPSIAMILYSLSAQQSAVALFTAGILPSLLIGLVGALYVMIYAHIKAVLLTSKARWDAIWVSTKEAGWSISTIVVILGGIYGGVFTPTEAAGVAVVYSLFVTMVVHREVGLRDLWRIIQSAVFLIAQILMIVAAAGLYSWLLTTSGIPQKIIAEVNALQLAPWALLLSLNVILLIMGSFLEPPAAILILTPLLLPLVQAVGVDPVHFGIIMTVNLSIGMYTPPFGLNLFASQAIFQTPLGNIYRGVLPFLAINFATLMVITYVPAISMVLLGK
jgi:C4-dicarboxylate transporter DctM subunit